MSQIPSLPALERLVADGQRDRALQMGLRILQAIDQRAGRLDAVTVATAGRDTTEEEQAVNFATRFAAAFGHLMTDPTLTLSAKMFEDMLGQHRWIALIFALSGFGSSDCFVALLAQRGAATGTLNFSGKNVLKLLLLLTPDTSITIDFDKFWAASPPAAAVAFLNYISSRYVFTRAAFDFRERMLEWLPGRLSEVKLGMATLSHVQEIYMHCSYANSADKHAIKRPLMAQMRRACLQAGIVETIGSSATSAGDRPTVVIVGEQFFPGHAVYRTHAHAVQSLRERFHVVGFVQPDPAGTPILGLFDECVAIPRGEFVPAVRKLAAEITARKPSLIFYLGVGMVPNVIAAASLRLAPVQCASFGHTATTMSPTIDYFVLPADFVGSTEDFSERVVAVPAPAMPFVSRAPVRPQRRAFSTPVRVAIAASTMKLNPMLFDAIEAIAKASKTPVAFHFFPLAATGLAYFVLDRIVRRRSLAATVHPQLPYEQYMALFGQCDVFLCPFPYGNMNSIIDAFQLGLPGVCLDGPQAHAHADAALFARIGLPAELIAGSLESYIAAAVHLIDDQIWRNACSDMVRHADLEDAFFAGDSTMFCNAIEQLIQPAHVGK